MSPPRSPKPSRSPRGTRASTRSPRSPNASLVRGSDPDHNRSNPKIDPDEESLAAARRSSRTKKSSQDVNDSTHEVTLLSFYVKIINLTSNFVIFFN
jgi:hypothetical protein